jgi:hypothetical protein
MMIDFEDNTPERRAAMLAYLAGGVPPHRMPWGPLVASVALLLAQFAGWFL